MQRRVPKAGFKNINHKEYFAVNLSTLQKLAEAKNLTVIGIEELKAAHLTNGKELVKVLGNGELTAKLEVKAHAFSKTAEEAIKAAHLSIHAKKTQEFEFLRLFDRAI